MYRFLFTTEKEIFPKIPNASEHKGNFIRILLRVIKHVLLKAFCVGRNHALLLLFLHFKSQQNEYFYYFEMSITV